MTIVSTDNAEHYHWGDQCDGWHLVKTPALSIIRERVPAGGEEIRHLHRHAEQFFFVLAGVATIEVTGTIHRINANQGIHIPAGVAHQLRNAESVELEFLVTSTPPSHGDRLIIES
ncbi:MAG: cupin domain-containing protein [Burkholderiaceae bacterium]